MKNLLQKLHKSFHYLGLVVLVSVLVWGSCVSAFATSLSDVNSSIDEKQQELENSQQELEEVEEDLESLESSIAAVEAQVNAATAEVDALQQQIDENRTLLANMEEELSTCTDNLNARLRGMYKNGTVGFIDVLLSSANIGELLSNLEMVTRIYQSDKELVTALQDQYQEILALQDDLDSQKSTLEAKLTELSTLQSTLNSKYATLYAQKSSLEEANAQLEEELADLEAAAAELAAASSGSTYSGSSSGGFVWPVPGVYVTSDEWGWRYCVYHGYELHRGLDIAAPSGSTVVAVADGVVDYAGWNSSYGYVVTINHGNNLYTRYAHNSVLLVSTGDTVTQGQAISYSGSTGNSTGPHVHFEVMPYGLSGDTVDPRSYF